MVCAGMYFHSVQVKGTDMKSMNVKLVDTLTARGTLNVKVTPAKRENPFINAVACLLGMGSIALMGAYSFIQICFGSG